jgi:hypothetical protein
MHCGGYTLNHYVISKRTFSKEEQNNDFGNNSCNSPNLLYMFFYLNTECTYLNLSDKPSKFLIFTIGLFVIVHLRTFHIVISYQTSQLTICAAVASASHAGSVLHCHHFCTQCHENRSYGLTLETDSNTHAHKHAHNTLATCWCQKSAFYLISCKCMDQI